MDPEMRASALDPPLLIAEISLLLDFISGRATKALNPAILPRMPGGCATYGEALRRYIALRESFDQSGHITPEDLQFLLEIRDYLNSSAAPATGATIAFSTLVTRKNPGAIKGGGDAERAYPEWIRLARNLRSFMSILQVAALAATLLIATLTAYVYWGNLIVSSIASLNSQLDAADKDVQREEISDPNKGAGGVERYCAAIPLVPDPSDRAKKVEVFRSATQSHVCDRVNDIIKKDRDAYSDLQNWISHVPDISGRDGVTDQEAAAVLAVLNGYAIPVLMGFLGASAYVLRLYLRNLGDRLLTPRDLRAYAIRIVLGILSGLAIGFFFNPGGLAVQGNTGLTSVVSLTAPAMAFLAGYAVEVLFRLLDGLAEQVFAARTS